MYGCQCPKRLWLHKYQPESRDEMDEEQVAIFQRGTDVGLLAQQLFPGGVNAAPPTPFEYQQSVADTANYINNGHTLIYEAAFQHEGILCAVDILVKKNEKWYAYEVKSSTSLKLPFVQDAALQYYVITNCGLALEDISVIHLNSSYIRQGDLDLQKLFTSLSVKKQVLGMQTFIQSKLIELRGILQSKLVPEKEMGTHCNKPYPCDFQDYCSLGLPEDEQEEEYINKKVIKSFLKELQYPYCFMDFETWMTAVPECDGHWSYRQIPFQFSLHIRQKPGDELQHFHYLAEHPHSQLSIFIERLIAGIGINGSVLVYNKTFENMILNQLKDQYPKLKTSITLLHARMVDLMTPFRKNYRLPAMQGSYSLKSVLPALVPEVSYDDLTITNGADASAAFYNLQHETDALKKEVTRQALLDYCGLDTMAMVRILEKLMESDF